MEAKSVKSEASVEAETTGVTFSVISYVAFYFPNPVNFFWSMYVFMYNVSTMRREIYYESRAKC